MGQRGNRQKSKLTDMGLDPEPESALHELYPLEDREEHSFTIDIDGRNRFIERMSLWKGRVVEFSIVQQHRPGADWNDVARADTCHDEVHLHRFASSSDTETRRHIRSIETLEDVSRGYDEACAMLHEHGEENVRRWARG